MHELINQLVDGEYLICTDGIFRATQKTKEITFHTRLCELRKSFKKGYKEEQVSFIQQDGRYIPIDF